MNSNSIESSDLRKELVKKRPFLLFKFDADNNLFSINEPGIEVSDELLLGDEPPILFMSIGNGEFVHHYRKEVTSNILKIGNSIILGIESQSKIGSYEELEYIKNSIKENSDLTLESGPAFIIPDEMDGASGIVEININNRDTLKNNFKYTWGNLEHLLPCSAKIVNGKAVSICRSVRKYKNILECGVDTVKAVRGMGYGSSVVAHWAKRVWENHQIPCYSTQWDNIASIALAKKMKLRQYAIDISINYQT